MEQDKTTVDTPTAVPETTVPPVLTKEEDSEARIAALEAEKAKLMEESANYKVGMMKAKAKLKGEENFDEEDDDRMKRIARETVAESRLLEIAREQDAIIQKALKENKELKLAQSNKTSTPPASIGTHSESQSVRDTTITPEQMAAFKARGWTEKDIERYKKNLNRYAVR